MKSFKAQSIYKFYHNSILIITF